LNISSFSVSGETVDL